jgi:hypothetical protein
MKLVDWKRILSRNCQFHHPISVSNADESDLE